MGLTKTCTMCQLDKELDQFYGSKFGKYGRRSQCITCGKEDYTLFTDPVKKREQSQRARAKTLEADPEARRWEALKRKYNLTKAQWLTLWTSQNLKCACCGRPPQPGEVFDTDHCHDTGKIRGILCCSCNLLIGKLGDSLVRAKKRAEEILAYLERTDG